jgi:hypothetical protein
VRNLPGRNQGFAQPRPAAVILEHPVRNEQHPQLARAVAPVQIQSLRLSEKAVRVPVDLPAIDIGQHELLRLTGRRRQDLAAGRRLRFVEHQVAQTAHRQLDTDTDRPCDARARLAGKAGQPALDHFAIHEMCRYTAAGHQHPAPGDGLVADEQAERVIPEGFLINYWRVGDKTRSILSLTSC